VLVVTLGKRLEGVKKAWKLAKAEPLTKKNEHGHIPGGKEI
jgi:hypothetical protein